MLLIYNEQIAIVEMITIIITDMQIVKGLHYDRVSNMITKHTACITYS